MSEPRNPYQAPDEDSTRPAEESPTAESRPLARAVEYAIAILLIIALIGVFCVFFTDSVTWLRM